MRLDLGAGTRAGFALPKHLGQRGVVGQGLLGLEPAVLAG